MGIYQIGSCTLVVPTMFACQVSCCYQSARLHTSLGQMQSTLYVR